MATVLWTGGANDGNWATAGNWNGGVPVDGDTVYIDAGNQNITAGLDQSGINLAALYITFGGSIGTASSALQLDTVTLLQYSGSGAYCNISAPVTTADILSTNGGVYRVSGGTTATMIVGPAARIEIEAAGIVTTCRMVGGSVTAQAGTAFTTLDQRGGSLESKRSVGTGNVSGATLQLVSTAAVTTSLTLWDGGRLNHRSSGTIAAIEVAPNAVADARGSKYNFTVTAATVYGHGKLFEGETVSVTKSSVTYRGIKR